MLRTMTKLNFWKYKYIEKLVYFTLPLVFRRSPTDFDRTQPIPTDSAGQSVGRPTESVGIDQSLLLVRPQSGPSPVNSDVQARPQSPKPAEPSPSRQSLDQSFKGLRARALSLASPRPRLQALVCMCMDSREWGVKN